MSVYDIIQNLSATSKRITKEAILVANKDNELLRSVFHLTYDPYIIFGIKSIPVYSHDEFERNILYTLNVALNDLNKFINRELTGNDAKNYLSNMLSKLSTEDAGILTLIIKKDLNCGVAESTINKIWPNLIPEFKLMKCHNSIEFIEYPAIAQTKSDGSRSNIKCLNEDGEYLAYSSSGRLIDLGDEFCEYVKLFMKPGDEFDGELVCYDDHNSALSRKLSNGIIQKAIKGTISKDEQRMIRFIAWDIIDRTSTIIYKDRFTTLLERFQIVQNDFLKFLNLLPYRIELIESEVVNSEYEALDFFNRQVERGNEGAIVKNYSGTWEPKRVKHQGKLKAEKECELEIVGYTYHSKDKNLMGTLVCSTSDANRQYEFKIGSGLTDDIRSMNIDDLIGKVVTVRFNYVIENKKNPGVYSLYLPRLIEIRHDKFVADSIDTILKL